MKLKIKAASKPKIRRKRANAEELVGALKAAGFDLFIDNEKSPLDGFIEVFSATAEEADLLQESTPHLNIDMQNTPPVAYVDFGGCSCCAGDKDSKNSEHKGLESNVEKAIGDGSIEALQANMANIFTALDSLTKFLYADCGGNEY